MITIGRVAWSAIMVVGVVVLVAGSVVGAQIAVCGLVGYLAWPWVLRHWCE